MCAAVVAPGDPLFVTDGAVMCEACQAASRGQCASCGFSLSGAIITAKDKDYHADCFVCDCCHTPIAAVGGRFISYQVGGNGGWLWDTGPRGNHKLFSP